MTMLNRGPKPFKKVVVVISCTSLSVRPYLILFAKLLIISAWAILSCLKAVSATPNTLQSTNPQVVDGEFIITSKKESYSSAMQLLGSQGLELIRSSQIADFKFMHVKDHAITGTLQAASSTKHISDYDPKLHDAYCEAITAKNPSLECEPNFVFSALSTPNDSYYSDLWGMETIEAPAAWNVATGSKNIVVAVIDSGIDADHPDLAANMWINSDEIPNNGNDDDGNGYIDDYYGYDFANSDGDPDDDHGHGSHCAGTIGAIGNNSIGVAGVAWSVSLMSVKALNQSGTGYTSSLISGIKYASDNGADVINASWGGYSASDALKSAIAAADLVFAAAAGNDGINNETFPMYPASYDLDNIIAVAAVGSDNSLASFSNYGSSSVDLAAPGVGILSAAPGGGYEYMNGTSMATPHVAGAAALYLSLNPSASPSSVIQALKTTAKSNSALAGYVQTGAILNIKALVGGTDEETPSPSPTPAPTATPNPGGGDNSGGGTITPTPGSLGYDIAVYGKGKGRKRWISRNINPKKKRFKVVASVPSAGSYLLYVVLSDSSGTLQYQCPLSNFEVSDPYFPVSFIGKMPCMHRKNGEALIADFTPQVWNLANTEGIETSIAVRRAKRKGRFTYDNFEEACSLLQSKIKRKQ